MLSCAGSVSITYKIHLSRIFSLKSLADAKNLAKIWPNNTRMNTL